MTDLRIAKTDVDWAVERGLLREEQAEPLWSAWSERRAAAPDVAPRFSITHVLYYLGGMMAIGAMTLFMNLGWERLGPWALFGIAVGYAIGCILASRSLAQRQLPLPAGIWWQKNEERLSAGLRARLPAAWREMRQSRHASMNND